MKYSGVTRTPCGRLVFSGDKTCDCAEACSEALGVLTPGHPVSIASTDGTDVNDAEKCRAASFGATAE